MGSTVRGMWVYWASICCEICMFCALDTWDGGVANKRQFFAMNIGVLEMSMCAISQGYCQYYNSIFAILQPLDPKLIDCITQEYAVCAAVVFGVGVGSVAIFMHHVRIKRKNVYPVRIK